jgi:exodeoxyribonuclease V beta subunit
MDFEFPLAGGDMAATAPGIHLRDVGDLVAQYLPAADPLASYAERLTGDALGNQSLRGYLNGSVDAVLRIPDGAVPGGHRYVVVDYKSNWLGDGDGSLTSADYERARLVEAMLHSDYPLQALLYCVVLHRFLRWRQPGYDPERHLGGVLYLFLFVRGMCGVDTPVVDGHRAGVFDWQPPASLIVAVSELLDAGRAAA